MPEVARFFGIVIAMYYDDHNPPHFHARYGNDKAAIEIASLTLLDGKLPPRVYGLVVEWAALHRGELMINWDLARSEGPLNRIAPLQ
ncbi:MAG: DUF4160 domain-containing protein [Candidatus Latescibacteria bacterium]|jgi:hypothetical protein|nr:DUF4160 domain-containing protein [Candidatus Latescibacterota bacterium]